MVEEMEVKTELSSTFTATGRSADLFGITQIMASIQEQTVETLLEMNPEKLHE